MENLETTSRRIAGAMRRNSANDNHPQEDAFMADGLRGTTVRDGWPKGPIGKDTAPPADVKAAIADEAKRIVTGARRAAYGKPEDNFARIARFWQAYFVNTGRDVEIAAGDVSPLMRLMKEARLCETPDHRDSYVDIVGYTLTGAEVNGVAA